MKRLLLFLALTIISPVLSAGGFTVELQVSDGIAAVLNGVPYRVIGDALVEIPAVRPFFEARGFVSAWVDQNNQPTPLAGALREFIAGISTAGLNPGDYWSPEMDKRWRPTSRDQAMELELLLTQSYLNLAGDLANGRVEPSTIDNEIDFKRRPLTDFVRLNQFLLSVDALKQGLGSLEPQHTSYALLKVQLQKYLALQQAGGWKALPAQKKLALGMKSSAVPPLRARLALTGQLDAAEAQNTSPVFDETLRQGVLAFQRQHSLTPDGVVGPQFYASLNIPVERRIQLIGATLEKWRWLPNDLGDRYIFVNLARQELVVTDHRQPVMKMKVVVGKVLRRTPSLADRIVDVALNPYWNVPQNLVLKDVLPGIKNDPNYLQSMGMKVFTPDGATEIDPLTVDWKNQSPATINFRFRQEPGDHNSLGIVKFNLTNSRAIYMHDTPHKELFAETQRNFSSGCIRLEKPVELASYLLKDTEWDTQKIKKFTKEPKQADHRIPLANPMPVYLVFLSVSFSEEGEPRFNSDNYGQDERLLRALQQGSVGQ